MKKWLWLLVFLPLTVSVSIAYSAPLMPDQAFALSVASTTDKGINLSWKIAPGYHLYRDRIAVEVDNSAANNNAVLGNIDLPPGIIAEDPIQGKYQEYQQQVKVNVPLSAPAQTPVTLLVDYQGCAQGSICYPPMTKEIKFNLSNSSSVLILNHAPIVIPAITTIGTSSSMVSLITSGSPMRRLFLEGAGILLLLMLIQGFVTRMLRTTRRLEPKAE